MSEVTFKDIANHRRANLARLLQKIVTRQATDDEFRLFFVELREHAVDPGLKRLLHASAHSLGLDGAQSPNLKEIERAAVCAQVRQGKRSPAPSFSSIEKGLFSYMTKSLCDSSGKSLLGDSYEERNDVYILKPTKRAPLELFETLFASFNVPPATNAETLLHGIDAALKNSQIGFQEDPIHSLTPVRQDFVLALAATIIGMDVQVSCGAEVCFNACDENGLLAVRAEFSFESREGKMLTFSLPFIETGAVTVDHADPSGLNHVIVPSTGILRTPPLTWIRRPDWSLRLVGSYSAQQHALVQIDFLSQILKTGAYSAATPRLREALWRLGVVSKEKPNT